jgi:hypothetical protein
MFLSRVTTTFFLLLTVGFAGVGLGVAKFQQAGAGVAQARPDPPRPPGVKPLGIPRPDEAHDASDASIPATIRGRVVAPDGKPVPRATVYLLGWKQDRTAAKPETVATTDADGQFRYDASRIPSGLISPMLVATAGGLACDWEPVQRDGPEMTLRLAAEVPVRGRLLDLEGKPVAGAAVKLLSVGTTTDGNLQAAFNAMRLNPEWLHFEKRIIPLAPAFTPEAKTDADGRFELKGIGQDRVAVLRFEAPGVEAARVYVVTQPDFDPKVVLPQPGEKEMVASGFAPGLRLAVYGPAFTHSAKPSHDITGRVTDGVTGKPIPNVKVVGTAGPVDALGEPHWGNTVETDTDRDGRFRLAGLPKASRRFLHVQPGDNPYLDRLIEVKDVEALKTVAVDIKLDRCVVIDGFIIDQVTGKPVRGEAKYLPMTDNPELTGSVDTRLYRDGFFSLKPTGTW